MGRAPCCDTVGLQKGPWTPEEDQKLVHYIQKHGHGSWRAVPIHAGLLRSGKSCRLRWTNYLRPDIKRGKFSVQEEQTIIHLHALLGNRWSAIATYLDKRTDNDIKNYWNTHLKKKLIKMGIDPVTHKPKLEYSEVQTRGCSAVTSHKTQWETARLEAEARLALESKLRNKLSACNTGSCLHYNSSFLLPNNSFSSFSMNDMNKSTSTETLTTSNQLYPLLVSSPNSTGSTISLQKSFKKRSSHIFSSFASNQLHGDLLELEAFSSFCSSTNHEYDHPLALDFKEFEQYPEQENPSSSSSVSVHYLHYDESCNFNLPPHESNSEHNLDYRSSNSSSQDDDYWINILDMHGELS